GTARAADWPMWRHDAQRSGSSPQVLPARLHLQWAREYPALQPAWPDQEKMQFDVAYEPVVAGQLLFISSSRHDCVRALDTRTGQERWTFFANGPVRFAPVIWEGRVYFTADDGYLYIKQPHNADSFAGVAPQGPMVVVGDRLLVPGGRSVPACLDRKTGKLLRFQLGENGKRGGGAEVFAQGDVFFNGGAVFELATEKYLAD